MLGSEFNFFLDKHQLNMTIINILI